MSRDEYDTVGAQCKKEEMAKLMASPEFQRFLADNSDRIQLAPRRLQRAAGGCDDDDDDEAED